ncbi:AI-2E family transporter [bacterium]|jgi:AI-2 transport protein TqsA|nr:AI-2E family transporter [bacterium]
MQDDLIVDKTSSQNQHVSKKGNLLITIASLFIIIAGLKFSQSIVIPVLLSLFITILASPFLFWLRSKKVPDVLSLVLIISLIAAFGTFSVGIIGSSSAEFSTNLPSYEAQLKLKTGVVFDLIESSGFNIDMLQIRSLIKPATVFQFVSSGLNQVGNMLAQFLLILLMVSFMLMETSRLYSKLSKTGSKRPKLYEKTSDKTVSFIQTLIQKVNRYMFLKTLFSLITAICVTLFLSVYNIHYPFLWGFLAFLLNFIPNVGSIIAAIPVILLGFIQYNMTHAIIILCFYLIINTVVGSIIEPKYMGKGLGLSPLFIFISLLFWGWLFGAIGMLLAIPLTMVVKIVLETNPGTQWAASIIGSS